MKKDNDYYIVGLNIETLWNARFCAISMEAILAETSWFMVVREALREWYSAPDF